MNFKIWKGPESPDHLNLRKLLNGAWGVIHDRGNAGCDLWFRHSSLNIAREVQGYLGTSHPEQAGERNLYFLVKTSLTLEKVKECIANGRSPEFD